MPTAPEPAHPQLVELSNEELDAISAGVVNVAFKLTIAQETTESFTQTTFQAGRTSTTGFRRRRRSIFSFQFAGTFESMDHFNSFYSGFLKLLGRG
jgi:uncharacterized protein YfdQ (DUF2303 family)